MPHERLRPSFVFDEEKLKQLQQIVPEAFADGNINWEALKESLGERIEEEEAEAEHFGLFWPGKREARKIASIPSKGALIPVKGEGINEETTKNIFIEGENLEVLKLFQKSYAGRIKMIYIDPPYNTGNDFIYDDNFTEPIEEYLKYTGQMDEEGQLLTSNKKTDGRFHSKWLSMMYPRLRLARNLLKDDGVIFISIDDNEVAHLRKICDEVFGEENYVGTIARKTKLTSNKGTHFAPSHEYIFAYSKNIIELPMFNDEEALEDEDYLKLFRFEDARGKYNEVSLYMPSLDPMRGCVNQRYFISCPDGSLVIPPGKSMPTERTSGVSVKPLSNSDKVWRWTFGTFTKNLNEKRVVFKETKTSPLIGPNGKQSKWNIYTKIYLHERQESGMLPNTFFEKYPNSSASKLLLKLGIPFPFSKPYELISWLQKISGITSNDIVLDFFAGSATTAHAVLDLNEQDNGDRKFILVQLPESCAEDNEALKAGYKTIADIGKERIRRAIKMLKEERKGKKNLEGASVQDRGFKVLKLNKSNFKQWEDYKGKDPKELVSLFKERETPLIDGWEPENLLVEVMLQEGFPLDSETIELKEYKKNTVIQVTSGFCEHKLLVCFDKKIYQETINALNIQGEDIFVCLDSALSDEQKITLSDKGFLKTI